MAKEEIIIDVQINVGDTEKKLGEVTASIYDLQEQNKALKKSLKDEGADYQELTKQIALNNREIQFLKVSEKELISNLEELTKSRSDYGDSFKQQEKLARDLESQYKSLTKAERESERGEQLRVELEKAKQGVNEINRSLGNFQDQVGNYEIANQSLKAELKAIVVEMANLKYQGKENTDAYKELEAQSKQLNSSIDGLKDGINDFVNSNQSLKSQLKEIVVEMANLKLAGQENTEAYKELAKRGGELKDTLADVQAELKNVGSDTKGIDQVIAGFEAVGAAAQIAEGASALFGAESEDVQRSIQKLVAIQSVMNGVQEIGNALQKESAFMLGVVAVKEKALAVSKVVITNLTRIFGITSAQAWAMATLGLSVLVTGIILLISNFNAIISKIKEFFGIAQNFDKVNDSIKANAKALENYGETTSAVANRLKALGKTEREILDYQRERYNEQLKLNVSLYNSIMKKGDEATDEEKKQADDALAFIKKNSAQKYEFQTQYIALTAKEKEDANKKELDAQKKLTDDYKKEQERRKELVKNALDASRALEDAQNEAIKDEVAKAIEVEKDANRRKIEDLKAKLAEDKNLTKKAKEDINSTIEQLQKNSDDKVAKITEDSIRAKFEKEITSEQKRLQLLLESAEKGSKNELNLRLQVIENLRQQELSELGLTEEQKLAINAKYNVQREDAEKQSIKRTYDAKKQAIDNEFAELNLKLDQQNASEVERANAKLTQAQLEAENLIALDQKTKDSLYETDEAYTSAVIASKQKVLDANKAVQQSEQKQFELQVAMAQGFGDAISNVLAEVASDSKEALVFQKFISLANASLNLATAISAATASSVAGDPYTMALRIASNVGSVIVSFAQVTKAINTANVPSPPKFASGGIVPGTSYSGDMVNARLNSGEMVLNQVQQQRLFDMIANGTQIGSNGIDYNALAQAISKQPAPVLNYSEFTQFQQKIVTFDELTRI